jgi:hypothetical protein
MKQWRSDSGYGYLFCEIRLYKTIMGTIPWSSSHSLYAAEAANRVRLLLFWPAALSWYEIWRCSPGLSGYACYSRTFRLSFPTPKHGSGTKRRSGPEGSSRRSWISFRRTGAEALLFWGPVTQPLKERFRFPAIYWTSWTGVHLFRLRLFWSADPEVWMNRIGTQLRTPFRFHFGWAVFYRSPDRSNIKQEYYMTTGSEFIIVHLI